MPKDLRETSTLISLPFGVDVDALSILDKLRPFIRQASTTLNEQAAFDVLYKTLSEALGASENG